MTNKSIKELFDREGEPVELDDVQRVRLVCFKCTEYIEEKFATLISPFEEFFSDEVYKHTNIFLCSDCYKQVMQFCGSVEE